MTRFFSVVLAALALTASTAQAAPPSNDDRADAQTLGSLPATVRGTTVDATNEPVEPSSGCTGTTSGSVWYLLPAAPARSLVLDLEAAGDLDAVVDVYRRERSQVIHVACAPTGGRGRAMLDFDQARNASYLIRVAQRFNSVADAFTLRVVEPDRPERPPGRALPSQGVTASVDRVANPDDAYAVSLSAGRSYRLHVVSRDRCVTVRLYPPGTSAFAGADPVRRFECDEYGLFTPGPGAGGRYSLHVVAPSGTRGARPYHLQVAEASPDDTAPGLELANDEPVDGSLRGGGVDVLDLYNFDVSRPSTLDLRLRTRGSNPFGLVLLGAGGRRIACACSDTGSQQIALKLEPGRYFAAVRSRGGANGSYVLSRLSRTITRTRVLIEGRRRAIVEPGRTVTIGVRVAPGANGPVTLDIERFDPIAGWQFHSRLRPTATNGSASVAFSPPSEGRWRVRAAFLGTRRAAPSGPSEAQLLVAEPLRRPGGDG